MRSLVSGAPGCAAAQRLGPATPRRSARAGGVCCAAAQQQQHLQAAPPEEARQRRSGGASRRRVLLSSCCCCAACAGRNPTMDRLFASAMSTGMQEYEAAVAPLKRRLFSQLAGGAEPAAGAALQVLELGIGTGPNLPYYPGSSSDDATTSSSSDSSSSSSGGGGPGGVELTGVDPNAYMEPFLRESAAAAGWDPGAIRWVEGAAEALPLPDASFDAVVCTLVLCSVGDVDAVLREAKRVLRPGGRFLFIEHTYAPQGQPLLRLGQQVMNPLQRLLADGCHLTRDPLPAIRRAFPAVDAERLVVEGPGLGLIAPHVAGIATV